MTGRPEFTLLPDVASRTLGGTIMASNDDFFADVHNLIAPGPARHDIDAFDARGKVYDGWETRRRREAGSDFVIVRLAAPAIIRAVDIDTSHFIGNYPPFAAVEGTTVLGYPTAAELHDAPWFPLTDKVKLVGDTSNVFTVQRSDNLVTHVRLTIYPDGGVARLRVFGEVVPDPRGLGGRVDLASILLGAVVEDCSNMFYSSPANVLAPGRAQVMSDGWETSRRRDDANDWMIVRLAAAGVVHDLTIDTTRFVGNAPGWAAVTDADTGATLLPRTRLLADVEHRFRTLVAPAVRRIRLDIYPDGGISRLRVNAAVPEAWHDDIAATWLGLLPAEQSTLVDPNEFFA